MSERLAILVPTYHGYRWIAPFMRRALDEHWPDHPPVFSCGLTPEEAGALPCLPIRDPALPRDWPTFVRDAAVELRERGVCQVYLLLEEHMPLAPCHAGYLNFTLPRLLDELQAAQIALMGWDNRRYSTRAPLLGPAHFRMMHLTGPDGPRFHLHPALWRIDALIACCELVLRGEDHSPWRFEKVCDKPDADLPEMWRLGCYQVCGRLLSAEPPGPLGTRVRQLERFFFHKMMALYPHLPRRLGALYWRALGFDDFFYHGPYPMFFSGVMAKGGLNPPYVRFMQKTPARRAFLAELLAEKSAHESGERVPS